MCVNLFICLGENQRMLCFGDHRLFQDFKENWLCGQDVVDKRSYRKQ